MKICVAQIKPVKGDVTFNIQHHKTFIHLAVEESAEMIVFPELSITGYEPSLAKELATTKEDERLEAFQQISDKNNIVIGVGIPLNSNNGIMIGMVIFQPHKPRETYVKQYLHADEFPFFILGQPLAPLIQHKIALAICYEISVPDHSEAAHENGAAIYIASVAKSVKGMEKAIENLSAIARKYSMITLISNCVGHCDDFECGGRSAVWNNEGILLAQLDNKEEGMLIIDTSNLEVTVKALH